MMTLPRMPCYKLNLRFNRDEMVKRFFASQLLDLYLGRARDLRLLDRAMSLAALPESWKADLRVRPAADNV